MLHAPTWDITTTQRTQQPWESNFERCDYQLSNAFKYGLSFAKPTGLEKHEDEVGEWENSFWTAFDPEAITYESAMACLSLSFLRKLRVSK